MSETTTTAPAKKPAKKANDRRKPGIVLLPPKGKRNVKVGGSSGANAFTDEDGRIVNPDGVKGGVSIGLSGVRVPCNGKAHSLIASGWTVAPGWEDRLEKVEAWRRDQVKRGDEAAKKLAAKKEKGVFGANLKERIEHRKAQEEKARKAALATHLEPEGK